MTETLIPTVSQADPANVESWLSPREQEARKRHFSAQDKAASYKYVAGYCRVSTTSQDYDSIEAQKRDITRSAVALGKEVYRFYIDYGYTGKNTERNAFQELIRDADKNLFGGVVTFAFSRYTRTLEDGVAFFAELNSRKIEVYEKEEKKDKYSAAQSAGFADKHHTEMQAFCKEGRKNKASNGSVPHAPCYAYDITPGKRGRHKKNPRLLKGVKVIFYLLDQNLSGVRVAEILNRDGRFPAPGAERLRKEAARLEEEGTRNDIEKATRLRARAARIVWTSGAVIKIARNERYRGDIIVGRKRVEKVNGRSILVPGNRADLAGSHVEALRVVSHARWYRVQERIDSRRIARSRLRAGIVRLGQGVTFCGICSNKMVLSIDYGRSNFRCNSFDTDAGKMCPGVGRVRLEAIAGVIKKECRRVLCQTDSADFESRYAQHLAFLTEEEDRKIREAEEEFSAAKKKTRYYREEIRKFDESDGRFSSRASLDEALGEAVKEETVAQRKIISLEEARGSRSSYRGIETLRDATRNIDAIVNRSADGADGCRLNIAINALVREVVVSPTDQNRVVELSIRSIFPSTEGAIVDIIDDNSAGWIGQEQSEIVDLKALAMAARVEAIAESRRVTEATALEGRYLISDEAFALAAPLCEKVDLSVHGHELDLRTLLNALIFGCRTRTGLHNLPPAFGDKLELEKVGKRLIFARAWDATVKVWLERSPCDVFGMSAVSMAYPSIQRTKARCSQKAFRPAPTAEELRNAIGPGNDKSTNLRLLAMARVEEGEVGKAVARDLDVSYSAMGTWRQGLRVYGIDGLRSKPKQRWMNDAQLEALKSARETGLHPVTGEMLPSVGYDVISALADELWSLPYTARSVYSAFQRAKKKNKQVEQLANNDQKP